jgi:hypothetical protein
MAVSLAARRHSGFRSRRIFVLRARAAQKSNLQTGLTFQFRRLPHERRFNDTEGQLLCFSSENS